MKDRNSLQQESTMSIYRVNLYNTFENIIKRKAFSAPSETHSLYKDLSEISKWNTLECIKQGNLILLCRGIRFVWAVAYASDDCRITDIDAFKPAMKYEKDGFRFVSLDIYKEYTSPLDGKKFFNNLVYENPFEDPHFCVEVKPADGLELDFAKAINKLLED